LSNLQSTFDTLLAQHYHADVVVQANSSAGSLLLVKVINASQPVRNLGQQTLLRHALSAAANEAFYDCFARTSSYFGPQEWRSNPYPYRTFNFFRYNMSLTLDNVPVNGTTSLGIQAGGRSEFAEFGWTPPAHYLAPINGPFDPSTPASIAVTITPTMLELVTTIKGKVLALQSLDNTFGATSTVDIVINLSGQSVSGSVHSSSRVQQFEQHLHHLDFHDADTFADTLGEGTILITSNAPLEHSTLDVVNTLPTRVAPAVLGPVTDQVHCRPRELAQSDAVSL
jgi:hypothetical protein